MSISMEKLTNSDEAIRLERNQPGCIWGIFHVLKYNRWRYAKKRLLLHRKLHQIDQMFEDCDRVHRIGPCDEVGQEEDQMKKTNPNDENDGFSPVIVPRFKDRTNNWVAIKRFKNIGHKIKHLMAFDKREKRRIAIDGVLDKIPKDEVISDEIKNEVIQKWKNCAIKNANQERNQFKRATSLNESMDKYRKLFQSFNKCVTKPDNNDDDGVKMRRQKTSLSDEGKPRLLGRILSLPNFVSSFLQDEETVSSKSRNRSSSFDSKNCGEINLNLRFQQLFDAYVESETKGENSDTKFTDSDEQIDSKVISSSIVEGTDREEEERLSIPKDTEFESGTFEIDAPDSKLATDDSKDLETLRRQMDNSIQVKPKDLELFNYVKEVLELSGFGAWPPSKDPTLDPSMFDEVEGRNLLKNPKCGGHMHIFDLINEVLIDIHQRSVTYWPRPLTSHCQVRPMPSGHHVLEQVWGVISTYLRLKTEHDATLDYIVRRELEKRDGWMNLQFEGECAGLELEESVFEDLLDELMFDDLLEELMWS